MNTRIFSHPIHGKCLFADNGIIEVGIALEFGLRIIHFSFLNEKNVFFEQPNDMIEFTSDEGWRIRGGHRLWIAPESPKTYCPDNDPIQYSVDENEILLEQCEDKWLQIKKKFQLSFEGRSLRVTHCVQNLAEAPLECSLWAISVMAPGGVEYIDLEERENGMDPWHRIAMWDYTNLGDKRAEYTREQIKIRHLPLAVRFKIGVGHPFGPVSYVNDGVVFKLNFDVDREKLYPDANVSYETYFSQHMVEMESLSPLVCIKQGETAKHEEVWELQRDQ